MTSASFIMSLDCEGKWGMADHLTDELCAVLTNEKLSEVYSKLVNVMRLYQIKASFAFVGALTMSVSEFQNRQDWFSDVDINGKPWLEAFKKDILSKQYDGWLHPGLLDIVRLKDGHEIASHGFTHLPLDESLISRDVFCEEMNRMQQVMNLKGLTPNTFVYPRNFVGYPSELKAFGIDGYRIDLFQDCSRSVRKARGLLSEVNIRQVAQEHSNPTGPEEVIKIPSGYFLNWRSHIRKKIPISISTQRWKSAIRDAIVHKKVVHLWTHPHNFITGTDQFKLLENIFKMVCEAKNRGELEVLTQREYCQRVLAPASVSE